MSDEKKESLYQNPKTKCVVPETLKITSTTSHKKKKSKKKQGHVNPINIKKKIVKDTLKSSQTSHQPSSSTKEKILQPFWNISIQKISDKLPSRSETDFTDLAARWSNNSYQKQTLNMWCSAKQKLIKLPENQNLLKTFPELSSLLPKPTISVLPKKEETEEKLKEITSTKKKNKKKIHLPLKTKKIRVYPTLLQRQLLAKWFDATRWTYNKCAAEINMKIKNKDTSNIDWSHFNEKFVNAKNFTSLTQKWVIDVPYDLRADGANDAIKAFYAYQAKKLENKNGFHLKFRLKRDEQVLTVRKNHWIHSSVFGSNKLKTMKGNSIPSVLPTDSRLIKNKLNQYFLCLCIPLEKRRLPNISTNKIVAIDPGVRTFLTCYDQDGLVTEFGNRSNIKRLYQLGLCVDKLQSKKDHLTGKKKNVKRNTIRKALLRIYQRIHNLVQDVHKKAVKWLLENNDVIFLPAFNSHQVISNSKKKGKNKLNSKAVRNMLHWNHGAFRERLIFKSQEYQHCCKVYIVSEEYTSKTCGSCGHLHMNLGSSKVFKCPQCSFMLDRDINGARNIWLKSVDDLTKDVSL